MAPLAQIEECISAHVAVVDFDACVLQVGSFAFTTLKPQLGSVVREHKQLLAADIPGLIAGAAQNKGLGLAFLRHIERTKMLAYVLDMSTLVGDGSGLQPLEQLEMLQVKPWANNP